MGPYPEVTKNTPEPVNRLPILCFFTPSSLEEHESGTDGADPFTPGHEAPVTPYRSRPD